MKVFIKKIRHICRVFLLSINEFFKNVKYTGFNYDTANKNKWRLILLAHSIEKGLTVCKERYDFGKQKAIDLLSIICSSNAETYKKSFEYKEAVSVLLRYKDFRQSKGLDIDFLKKCDSLEINDIMDAGEKLIKRKDIIRDKKSFAELCKNRHSVREYDDSYVEIEKIIEAIDISKYAPSACNRQMIKVFFSTKDEDNKLISSFIPGNNGSKDEKAIFLVICADMTAFDYFEVNQWYLNGGIYTGFLTLALTDNNVANCIYQWPMNYKNNKQLKKILDIPKHFEITNIISVGNYKTEFRIATSSRRDLNEYYVKK